METLGATGARLLKVTVVELLSVPLEVSVTVTAHWMVSVPEAKEELRVRLEPVPKVEPVVELVQV